MHTLSSYLYELLITAQGALSGQWAHESVGGRERARQCEPVASGLLLCTYRSNGVRKEALPSRLFLAVTENAPLEACLLLLRGVGKGAAPELPPV